MEKPKPKLLQWLVRIKVHIVISLWEFKVKTSTLLQEWKMANVQVVIVCSCESDWLRGLHSFVDQSQKTVR